MLSKNSTIFQRLSDWLSHLHLPAVHLLNSRLQCQFPKSAAANCRDSQRTLLNFRLFLTSLWICTQIHKSWDKFWTFASKLNQKSTSYPKLHCLCKICLLYLDYGGKTFGPFLSGFVPTEAQIRTDLMDDLLGDFRGPAIMQGGVNQHCAFQESVWYIPELLTWQHDELRTHTYSHRVWTTALTQNFSTFDMPYSFAIETTFPVKHGWRPCFMHVLQCCSTWTRRSAHITPKNKQNVGWTVLPDVDSNQSRVVSYVDSSLKGILTSDSNCQCWWMNKYIDQR